MSLHCCYAASPCTSPPLPCHCFALLRPTAALSCVSLLQSAAHTAAMMPSAAFRSVVLAAAICCNAVHSVAMLSAPLQHSPLCSNAVHSAATQSTLLQRSPLCCVLLAAAIHCTHCCPLRCNANHVAPNATHHAVFTPPIALLRPNQVYCGALNLCTAAVTCRSTAPLGVDLTALDPLRRSSR